MWACALAPSHLCSDCSPASVLWLPKAAKVVAGRADSASLLLLTPRTITPVLPQATLFQVTSVSSEDFQEHGFPKPMDPLIDVCLMFAFDSCSDGELSRQDLHLCWIGGHVEWTGLFFFHLPTTSLPIFPSGSRIMILPILRDYIVSM